MVWIRAARLSASVLVAVVLAACGGGGGGGGGGTPTLTVPPAPPAPLPPPPAVRPPPVAFPPGATPSLTGAEYQRNWGVAGVKAEAAWSRGFTGRNVVVGVIDDGLIPTDPEIAGRVHPGSKDIVDSRNQLTGPGTHGTELAVFIAGAFNDVATVGVAYEATILGIRADDPGCFTTSCGFLNADLARGLDYAVSQGAKVVNFSLGSSNPSSQAFRDALARATAAGTIIVVSAGNDGPLAPDVNFPGRYANDPTISSGLILTVGAINPAGALANFSNVAGPSQNWYLVAPGDQVFTIDSGAVGATDPAFQTCFPDFTCRMQGTSYSAPHVAGGIALLLQAFPGLTPQQIVQLALQSAEDVGAPGVDSTFGRGRFNIERAFAPIGPLSAPLAGVAGGSPVGSGLGVSGSAFGDSFQRPGLWRTVAFDSFGRTFSVDLGSGWSTSPRVDVADDSAPALWGFSRQPGGLNAAFALTEPQSAVDARTRDRGRAFRLESSPMPGWSVAFASQTAALTDAGAPLQVGAFGLAGRDASVAVTRALAPGAALSFASQSGVTAAQPGIARGESAANVVRLNLQRGPISAFAALGAVREEGRALGLAVRDQAGGAPDARTATQAFALSAALSPRLDLDAAAEFGRTRIEGGPAWLRADGDLRTAAYRVALRYDLPPARGMGGSLSLSVSQPLRVESGTFGVLLPDADAFGRASLTQVARRMDAAPTGREIETRLGYTAYAGARFAADASIAVRHEPGHIAGAPPEAAARIGLRVGF